LGKFIVQGFRKLGVGGRDVLAFEFQRDAKRMLSVTYPDSSNTEFRYTHLIERNSSDAVTAERRFVWRGIDRFRIQDSRTDPVHARPAPWLCIRVIQPQSILSTLDRGIQFQSVVATSLIESRA
jgi:hypothetical protein